ncbi:EAL domain-containing protein [Vibrio europaeus]|uniref:EAL domain-containing protein n=1 Tax=Vibrio europaeus TaxID=300876 RepID=UPI0039E0515B
MNKWLCIYSLCECLFIKSTVNVVDTYTVCMRYRALLNRMSVFSKKESKPLWLDIVFIYAVIVLFGLIVLKPLADRHIVSTAKYELTAIEHVIDQLREKLNYLTSARITSLPCEDVTTLLRSEVFKSDVIKEIGLFRPSGEIYCTSSDLGNSFYLYKTIMGRLDENGVTLSYTKSKMTDERSVFLMFLGESNYGVSVAIPPRYIQRLLERSEDGVFYDIEVISRKIVERSDGSVGIDIFTQESRHYPLGIKLHTYTGYYIHYFVTHIWIGLLLGGVASVIRVRSRQNKVSDATLESALQNALIDGEIEAYYQPIVNSQDRTLVGCESLVRWKSPSQGMISPVVFIPLAEELGLIDDIADLVLASAIDMLTKNPELFEQRYISINISRSQILRDEFVHRILHELKHQPHIARKLIFEITEEMNFSSEERLTLRKHLEQISKIGLRVAIDDFGTGYSGLDFIRQYTFDVIKIDRVFVNSLGSDSTLIPLLQSMKGIANSFNMDVIVEGVEEERQVKILAELGFYYIQGFYYFKPMSKHELLTLLCRSQTK